MKIKYASLIYGDNMGVIQNSTIAESLLKKRHVAIAFREARVSAASRIYHPINIRLEHDFTDLFTKAVSGKTFWSLYGKLTSE